MSVANKIADLVRASILHDYTDNAGLDAGEHKERELRLVSEIDRLLSEAIDERIRAIMGQPTLS
ncbi:MAG: hypothetical protein QHC90_25220 [Shinella sp.]|nr:hypothetical protein [Shinella sp.]